MTSETLPFDLSTSRGRFAAHMNMLFVDHAIFRVIYDRRFAVSEELERASHPTPYNIKQAAERGVKTIVNLRGENGYGSYALEKEACDRHGIELVSFRVKSRDVPQKDLIHNADDLFKSITYPALMHCKTGADRVGLMSVLYLVLRKGEPVSQAIRHLALRYGHIKQAKTGILDFFLEQYIVYDQHTPISFLDWVDQVYDPASVKDAFHAQWWAGILVDKILRRE